MSKIAYDAVIVGGGHNGLVCASYLAEAGFKVKIVERRSVVGGAATTEEFHPGFRNSMAAYTVSLLNPKVIEDLHLYQHGLKIVERSFSNFLPLSATESLSMGADLQSTQVEFAKFSKKDAAVLPAYYDMLEKVADVLRKLILTTPVAVGGGLTNIVRAVKVGGMLRKLEKSAQYDVLDMFTKSAAEILDQWFENDHLKAVFAFDAVVGNYASPWTPGSAYVLLHHVFGEVNGKKGTWGHAVGGMGAITQAMAKEAKLRGVEIQTDAAVKKVLVEDSKAIGVELEDGTQVLAKNVIANVNPKLLYLQLMDEDDLDSDFIRRIKAYRCGSATFRMNVALSELPSFTCKPGNQLQPHHQSGIIMAPSMKYMEQAYMDARKDGWSKKPIVEMLIPSTVDDSLAPEGQHVASLFCQHFDPELSDGRNWHDFSEQAADLIIDTVNAHAPNFKASVIARTILSPLDLEEQLGLVAGDIMHGSLGLDQLYSNRPLMGYGDYHGPLQGLYMCGSGTHPGGGVTGAPGYNAAREFIRDNRFKAKA